jgi:hypothetical protein
MIWQVYVCNVFVMPFERRMKNSLDAQGLVHIALIPEWLIVNEEMDVEIPRCLRNAMKKKLPGKWAGRSCFLLQGNAPVNRSLVFRKCLAKQNVTALDHPLCSLDLSLPGVFLPPRPQRITRAEKSLQKRRGH